MNAAARQKRTRKQPPLPAQPRVPQNHTATPNELWDSDLDMTAKVVVHVMRSFGWRRSGGVCKAGLDKIAKRCSISKKDTIMAAQRRAESAGWLRRYKTGGGGYGITRTTWWIVYDIPHDDRGNDTTASPPDGMRHIPAKRDAVGKAHPRQTGLKQMTEDRFLTETQPDEGRTQRARSTPSVVSAPESAEAIAALLAHAESQESRWEKWERAFMPNVREIVDAGLPLTAKQLAKLKAISRRLKKPSIGSKTPYRIGQAHSPEWEWAMERAVASARARGQGQVFDEAAWEAANPNPNPNAAADEAKLQRGREAAARLFGGIKTMQEETER